MIENDNRPPPRPGEESLPMDGKRPEAIPDSSSGVGWLIVALVAAGMAFLAWRAGLFQPAGEQPPDDGVAVTDTDDAAPAVTEPEETVEEEAPAGDEAADPELRAEADAFVSELVATPPREIPADEISHFVTPEQKIRLPGGTHYEEMAIGDIAERLGVGDDDPITIITNSRQLEYRTVRELLEQARADPEKTFDLLLEDDRLFLYTPEQLRREYEGRLDDTVAVMILKPEQTVTRLSELLARHSPETIVRVVPDAAARESETVTTVSEMLHGQQESREGDVYHVHTVRDNDSQGLWGIIHDGLVGNFARGIALRRGENLERYRIKIPRHADEMENEHTSSYLGKKIHEKARESHLYNYSRHRMGADPNTIYPDQEVVITKFTMEELIEIYEHFVKAGQEKEGNDADA